MWPILIAIGVIAVVAYFIYKKDHGSRSFPLNRYCLACHKRFPDKLANCPYCNEPYFSHIKK